MIVNSVSYLICFCQPNLFIFTLKDGIFEPKTLVNFSVEDNTNLLRWEKQLHNFLQSSCYEISGGGSPTADFPSFNIGSALPQRRLPSCERSGSAEYCARYARRMVSVVFVPLL